MDEWIIIPGPASKELATNVAMKIGGRIVEVECTTFPDGESRLSLSDNVGNQPVILIQSTYPPVDRHILQTFFLAHKLSEEGAEVHAVIPYLAYSRQDKEFLQGEVVSIRVLARLFRSVGIKRLLTVDIHSLEGLSNFSIPAYSVSAIPFIADYIRKNVSLSDLIAVSPDFGGSSRVEAFSKILGVEHLVFEKKRDLLTGDVSIKDMKLNLDGKDAIILDDIISTGGSVQRAAIQLKNAGVKRITVACTHPILVDKALDKMREAGVDEVIGTNTIPSKVSKVDVSPAIVEHFKTLG